MRHAERHDRFTPQLTAFQITADTKTALHYIPQDMYHCCQCIRSTQHTTWRARGKSPLIISPISIGFGLFRNTSVDDGMYPTGPGGKQTRG